MSDNAHGASDERAPTSVAEGTEERGLGLWGLSLQRNFGPFFYTQLLHAFGTWVQNLAAVVLIYEVTKSAVMVGAVSAVQFGSMLLLSPLSGAIADRYNKRLVSIWTMAISAASIGVLTLWSYWFLDHPATPAVVLGTIGIKGIAMTLSSSATKAMIPSLVSEQNLHPAVALDQMTFTIGRSVGPGLGALFLLVGGPALAFTYTTVSCAAFAIGISLVHPLGSKAPRVRAPFGLWGGFGYVRRNKPLRNLVIGVAFLGFAVDPTITLTPSLADSFDGGANMVAAFVTAFGLGSICSALVTTRLSNRVGLRETAVMGMLLCSLGLAVVAASWTPELATAGFLLAGVGYFFGNVAIATRVQILVPDALRGRVMAIWAMSFFGLRPIASLLNGTLADLVSVRSALIASLTLAGCGALILSRGGKA